MINIFNQKENKSGIPYQYKLGDQVFLETPGILLKLSTPHTRTYPITNVYMNVNSESKKAKRNCIRMIE
jgi:hypothetical protein